MKRSLIAAHCAVLILSAAVIAHEQPRRGGRSYPPRLSQARSEVYRTTGDIELRMYGINGDGAPDVLTASKPGGFVFLNRGRGPGTTGGP